MNIAINGLLLKEENSGVEQIIYGLLAEFAQGGSYDHRFTFILGEGFHFNQVIRNPNIRLIKTGIDPEKRLHRILWENFFLPLILKSRGIDLYHSPGYVLPLFPSVPSLVTVHDLIALRFPQWCKKSNVIYYQIFLPYAVRRAKRIITLSKTVKEELVRYLKVPEERISVIRPGIDSSFKPIEDPRILLRVRRRYGLPDRFILFVGNLEPKKNLKRLLDAFGKVKTHEKIEHKLVITGKKGWKYKDIFKTLENNGLRAEVIFTGYCCQEDLPALYSMADLFVFPSLYEGFGLPPIEAMACGTPVLTSDREALSETTGGCTLMVNPEDIDDIAKGIVTLLFDKDMRRSYVEKGRKWAEQFTWEKAARKTLRVYEEVVEPQRSQ